MRFLHIEDIDDHARVARPKHYPTTPSAGLVGGIEYTVVHDWRNEETPFRSEAVREAVDALPPAQRHMIERHFFGGEYVSHAAAEIGLKEAQGKAALEKGLEALREHLLSED